MHFNTASWVTVSIHIRVYQRNAARKDCVKGDEQPACQRNHGSVEAYWQKKVRKKPVEAYQTGRQKTAEWMYFCLTDHLLVYTVP